MTTEITASDLGVLDDHIDLFRDYSRLITHMQEKEYESVHLTGRLTVYHAGFCIHDQEPMSSWLPFLKRQTSFHYFKIPRFVDIIEDIRFVSIPAPKKWVYVINNHVLEPDQTPLYILNRYLSYLRIQDVSEKRMDLDLLVTCTMYRPDMFPTLWESYTRWYYYLPPDIMDTTLRLELFHSIDLSFFEPFCMGLRGTRIMTKNHDKDHLVITVATKEKPELLHEFFFHKFPSLKVFLLNDNGAYPIVVETTLLFL